MTAYKFNRTGFTFVETMVVVAILSFLIAATYGAFVSGQTIWTKTNNTIELEEHLGRALDRIVPELRQTGHESKGIFQVSVDSQTGVGGSDIFRFSIPVICESGGNPVNANGDTAHWGAPLTWGCNQASCMDENNNCDTVEYKFVEYRLNEEHQIIRRVLDFGLNVVREDVISEDIVGMRIEPNFDQRMLTLKLTAQKKTGHNQTLTQELETKIRLRNAR
jgi:prepilin-type N-terminal cleavage/methylation domain-containing protein